MLRNPTQVSNMRQLKNRLLVKPNILNGLPFKKSHPFADKKRSQSKHFSFNISMLGNNNSNNENGSTCNGSKYHHHVNDNDSSKDLPMDGPSVVAERKERKWEIHGYELCDPYYYIRDKKDKMVMDYIVSENEYCSKKMKHTEPLQRKLYDEMVGRIEQTDESIPYKHGQYEYYSRTVEKRQYRIYCRKSLKNNENGKEEIILDLNEIADNEKLDYLDLGHFTMSPNHRYLCYSIDNSGNELYTTFIKDLHTGELLPDVIKETGTSVEWGNNDTIYFDRKDKYLRSFQIFRKKIRFSKEEQESHKEECIFTEDDEKFFVSIEKSHSGDYLFLSSDSILSSEVYFLPTKNADDGNFVLLSKRKQNLEYSVYHHGDYFYILTNEKESKNFKIIKTHISEPSFEKSVEVIAHNPKRYLCGLIMFRNHIVISVREHGLKKLLVMDPKGKNEPYYVSFPEVTYQFSFSENKEFDTNKLRIKYSSLITPQSIFEYDLDQKQLKLLKEDKIYNYNRNEYHTMRLHAVATDSTEIPISLVFKKGNSSVLDCPRPCLLVGYGSYGIPYDASFSSDILSLLDRGFIFAIAHVRGGGESGRLWYEDGKFLKKKNTFTDFIDCCKYLINNKYTSSDKLVASGGSAGGLLMGAVLNMDPELFRAMILDVPFVDVINSMTDKTIPLTVTEFEEWGNPIESKEFFDCLYSYSPYDNIDGKENLEKQYPSMLVMSGLNDPRVMYWEPTKYVAKMRWFFRKKKKGANLLLLKTEMGSGHFGLSGRYEMYKEKAFKFSFILQALGINE